MNRILVVEDETVMAELLCEALTVSGYECQLASNGKEGLDAAQFADLLVVDVMMPVLNGFDMVATLRARGFSRPVLFLTAKDDIADVVAGFDVGGDDYLVKPFKLDELLVRIRALLRRAKEAGSEISWHHLALNLKNRTGSLGNHEIFLSSTEFALLEFFVEHADKIVSKPLILQKVWKDEGYRSENIIEIYVNYLRKKTELYGHPRIIHTVRGRGYVLAKVPPQP